jgi:hypothetical protein
MRNAWGLVLAGTLMSVPMMASADGLWHVSALLHAKKWVDLTHPFDADIPHWKGFDPLTRKAIYDYEKDGFRAEMFCHVGQWGTHLDPPAHFHKGARTADKIPVTEMLLPLVVIDVHRQVAKNADFVLALKDVKAWEARHGAIPKGRIRRHAHGLGEALARSECHAERGCAGHCALSRMDHGGAQVSLRGAAHHRHGT